MGTYVAVGDTGLVLTSNDTKTWVQRSVAGTTDNINDVISYNNKFIASSANFFYDSTDGITWNRQSLFTNDRYENCLIVDSLNRFVCLNSGYYSGSDRISYSTDGLNWSHTTLPAERKYGAIIHGNGLYLVFPFGYNQAGNNTYLISTDLVTWTSSAFPANTFINVGTYAPDKAEFLIVTATGVVYTSSDGVNWTLRANNSITYSSIIYQNGAYLGVRPSGYINRSTNAITWTQVQLSTSNWRNVAYGGGLYAVCGYQSNAVRTSTDGITWSAIITLPNTGYHRGIAYGNGRFVIVREDSAEVKYSTDGVTWTSASTVLPFSGGMDIEFNGSVFCAVSGTGFGSAYSTDGVTWFSTQATKYKFSKNSTVLTCAAAGGRVNVSTDGLTWSVKQTSTTNILYATASSDNMYIAVGAGGAITYSTDLNTWANATSGTIQILWSAGYFPGSYLINNVWYNGIFIATGGSGVIRYSADGITWYTATTGTTQVIYSIVNNGKFFIATLANGQAIISVDAVKWTNNESTAYAQAVRNSLYIPQNDEIMMVGASVGILKSTQGY